MPFSLPLQGVGDPDGGSGKDRKAGSFCSGSHVSDGCPQIDGEPTAEGDEKPKRELTPLELAFGSAYTAYHRLLKVMAAAEAMIARVHQGDDEWAWAVGMIQSLPGLIGDSKTVAVQYSQDLSLKEIEFVQRTAPDPMGHLTTAGKEIAAVFRPLNRQVEAMKTMHAARQRTFAKRAKDETAE